MEALAICGSPRNGNTEILLKRSLAFFEKNGVEINYVHLKGKKVSPCISCGVCRKEKNGKCAVKDDFEKIFEMMKKADIIIVGSPVYCGSATPELMALLDRSALVSLSSKKYFSRKVGGPIVVARRAGQNFTFAQLLYFFMINEMIVPGSTYWNIAFGHEAGGVNNDEEGLRTIDRFSENLLWLAQKLEK